MELMVERETDKKSLFHAARRADPEEGESYLLVTNNVNNQWKRSVEMFWISTEEMDHFKQAV